MNIDRYRQRLLDLARGCRAGVCGSVLYAQHVSALGLVTLESKADFDAFIETAKKHRIWHRERLVRPPH